MPGWTISCEDDRQARDWHTCSKHSPVGYIIVKTTGGPEIGSTQCDPGEAENGILGHHTSSLRNLNTRSWHNSEADFSHSKRDRWACNKKEKYHTRHQSDKVVKGLGHVTLLPRKNFCGMSLTIYHKPVENCQYWHTETPQAPENHLGADKDKSTSAWWLFSFDDNSDPAFTPKQISMVESTMMDIPKEFQGSSSSENGS